MWAFLSDVESCVAMNKTTQIKFESVNSFAHFLSSYLYQELNSHTHAHTPPDRHPHTQFQLAKENLNLFPLRRKD